MKFKKIIGIGDSWTFGEGGIPITPNKKEKLLNSNGENVLGVPKAYYDFCTPNSWVAQLAKMYGCDYEVYAVPGCSNENIMNNTHRFLQNYDKDTLVIVMWSSKFRDRIFALPSYEKDATSDRWMFKSEDMILNEELWERFTDSGLHSETLFKKFKKKFISEIYNEIILDYYTMCYKLYTQFILEESNIPYIMCNAFEKQLPHTTNDEMIVPYHLLNKKYYYKPDSTMCDDLKNNSNKMLWENNASTDDIDSYTNGLHPNKDGYFIIAEKLKKFIDVVHK